MIVCRCETCVIFVALTIKVDPFSVTGELADHVFDICSMVDSAVFSPCFDFDPGSSCTSCPAAGVSSFGFSSSPFHSYPPLFRTATSRPMTLILGCPWPQPSSSALGPLSRPMLTALLRELALTTACARLNRELGGCSGIVCRNSSTANARTRGARFVTSVVLEITSSFVSQGSDNVASYSAGGSGARSSSRPPLSDDLDRFCAALKSSAPARLLEAETEGFLSRALQAL